MTPRATIDNTIIIDKLNHNKPTDCALASDGISMMNAEGSAEVHKIIAMVEFVLGQTVDMLGHMFSKEVEAFHFVNTSNPKLVALEDMIVGPRLAELRPPERTDLRHLEANEGGLRCGSGHNVKAKIQDKEHRQ